MMLTLREDQRNVIEEDLVLFQCDGVSYEVLTSNDLLEVIRCLMDTFLAREPMTRKLQISSRTFKYFTKLYCEKAASEGLSIVAKEVHGRTLMGCLISEDFASEPPSGLDTVHSEFYPILALLDTLDKNYKDSHRCEKYDLLHEFLMGVYSEHKGRNIGYNLVEANHILGRKKGFRGAIAEATGSVSQRIFVGKHHYQVLDYINYNDFEFQGKACFEGILDCDSCQLVQKNLHSEHEDFSNTY